METRYCERCGDPIPFNPKYNENYYKERRYCSKRCAGKYPRYSRRVPRLKRICKNCEIEFEVTEAHLRHHKANYCSIPCANEHLFKGKPKSEEHNRKNSEAHIGKEFTEEHCKNLSTAQIERFERDGPTKTAWQKGDEPWNKDKTDVYSDETLEKMSRAALRRENSPGYHEKKCLIIQARWADPAWAEQQIQRMVAGQQRRPTKPELELFQLLNDNAYPYIYTGDGGLWIGRKNPDLIWPEQRKVIEMYGSYWHDNSHIKPRIEYFTNYGFQTLIIWDYELDEIESLLMKLQEFHK